MITDDITNRFAAEFTKGLESIASQHQYSIIISDLHEDPANEARSIGMLLNQRVDGIIYAGFGQEEQKLRELFSDGLPVVVVDQPLPSGGVPSVLIDNAASVSAALRHLSGIGRTEIVFINGLAINRNAILRAQAFEQFASRHSLPFDGDAILYGDFTLQHGYQTALRLLREKRSFNALFCGDDTIAFGAMAALKARGRRIPEDVAVVGFDDDPLAPVFEPSLTTVHYPMQEMGRLSFKLFQRMLARRRRTPEHIKLETKLVVRRSTDPRFKEYQDFTRGT
jgi:LacI family transcriptional regulator